ncbi:hypothetical protein TNCT_659581 [Trichonephila clavata]|uniref:Uncharacterized protein n=1 Tax=Trichonephila clavata TaxID=2740835 RepID=A0A8X6FNM5_TRICU|nr:hypothetical protein TNCT_659581 [Trichonephila clavata]
MGSDGSVLKEQYSAKDSFKELDFGGDSIFLESTGVLQLVDCGRRGFVEYPDLTPLDIFLWRYLKDKVYAQKPATVVQLRATIEHELRISLGNCSIMCAIPSLRVISSVWSRTDISLRTRQ